LDIHHSVRSLVGRPVTMRVMAKERIVMGGSGGAEEEKFNLSLRPQSLDDYVGQPTLVEKLRITLEAVKQRGEPMEHVLLHGPPGLGKTTLSHIIANELFIDEIHRLPAAVEEFIYPAMEDFKIDFTIDTGMHAKTIPIDLKPFTLIGATTRAGLLSGPMRSRFGIAHNLEFYGEADLLSILRRSADLLQIDVEAADDALHAIARRSRGTPRIANRLLRRVRDYSQVKAHNTFDDAVVDAALKLEGVDDAGLDAIDRKYLKVIGTTYEGGPVGLEAVAATLGEDAGTLESMVEPYLLQLGLLARTRKGRMLTREGAGYVGVAWAGADDKLFSGG